MSNWNERERDIYKIDEEEEKLLEKFHDYIKIQNDEIQKRYNEKNSKIFKKRRVFLALVEGIILTGLTASFLFFWYR